MNVFSPIPHERKVAALQAVSPVAHFRPDGFDALRNMTKASEEKAIRFLQQSPRYLFMLGAQYFCHSACGAQSGINTRIIVDPDTDKDAAAVCKFLFRKVLADEILLHDGRTTRLLSVQGIEAEGIQAFERLADPTLRVLYCAAPADDPDGIDNDRPPHLYTVTSDANAVNIDCGAAFAAFAGSPLTSWLDVSALTFRACAESPLIAHIAARAEKTILSVDTLPTGQTCKIVLWRA